MSIAAIEALPQFSSKQIRRCLQHADMGLAACNMDLFALFLRLFQRLKQSIRTGVKVCLGDGANTPGFNPLQVRPN